MLFREYTIDDLKTGVEPARLKICCSKILSFGLILIIGGYLLAQDAPKARIIDEFPVITCEDWLARADYIGHNLVKEPGSEAFVLIGRASNQFVALRRQAIRIHRALIGGFAGNKHRVTFISADNQEFDTQVWLVPHGAQFAPPAGDVIAQIPFRISNRTLFVTETEGPCWSHDWRGFVEMLNSAQSLSGYVVLVNIPYKERSTTIKYFQERIVESGLQSRRIRLYFNKNRERWAQDFSYYQYWLVPKRNR